MKRLKPFSFRLDPDQVELARILGFDLNEVIRNELERITKSEKCPTCGQGFTNGLRSGVERELTPPPTKRRRDK